MAVVVALDHLRQAAELAPFDSGAARMRMAPKPRGWQKRDEAPQPAAVMILISPAASGQLRTVLTLRAAGLRGHSGQVSFPGGRRDPQDDSLTATALRETCEEIGVCGARLAILGQFPQLYIPASHHQVSPVIAFCHDLPPLKTNPEEVAAVFSFALDDLLRTRFKAVERRRIRGVEVRAPYYLVQGQRVWGATAMLLSELEARLRRVMPRASLQALE